MNDTVKLIIEIPKYDYEEVGHLVADGIFDYNGVIATVCKAIANGIPLDDVKAEIAKPIQEECCYIGEARIQADTIKWCLEILDNIGKAESED